MSVWSLLHRSHISGSVGIAPIPAPVFCHAPKAIDAWAVCVRSWPAKGPATRSTSALIASRGAEAVTDPVLLLSNMQSFFTALFPKFSRAAVQGPVPVGCTTRAGTAPGFQEGPGTGLSPSVPFLLFNAVCLPAAESGTAANTDRSAVQTKNCSASLQTVIFCLCRSCFFYTALLQDLVALVAPLEEGGAVCPPPLGSVSAPSCASDFPGLPPSLPPSLADTQPFIVDLENQAAPPNAQPCLAAAFAPGILRLSASELVSFCSKTILAPSILSLRAVGGCTLTWPFPWRIFSFLVYGAPLPSPGSVPAPSFAPRSRWHQGSISSAYRPRGLCPPGGLPGCLFPPSPFFISSGSARGHAGTGSPCFQEV